MTNKIAENPHITPIFFLLPPNSTSTFFHSVQSFQLGLLAPHQLDGRWLVLILIFDGDLERMASTNLVSPDDFVIGIIGMGDMGKMYARRLSDAGWR